MSLAVFSAAGAAALGEALAASERYGRAAADWEGAVLLQVDSEEEARSHALFLDLWHGACRAARLVDSPAESTDRERADYILGAPEATWESLLGGRLDPLTALFGGRIRLERGRLLGLAPHVEAARELLAIAAEVNRSISGRNTGARTGAGGPAGSAREPAPPATEREHFQTTSGGGLDPAHPAMRLWRKAKRDGIWDPMAIDLERDRADWRRLDSLEREVLLHLTSQFQAGEEAVTRDLVPLLAAIGRCGRLEEEIYLTSFLWEEAKHVELFHRFFDEVVGETGDLERFHGAAYRRIFYDELPRSLDRLRDDPRPETLAEASVTYNMIVEGVLAETGYHAYQRMLVSQNLLPGMQRAIEKLRRDESRHIAYGVFLLSRLVCEHGEELWSSVDRRMSALLPLALESVREIFATYDRMPFGLELEHFAGFATQQFERRYARIELARRQSLDDLYRPGAVD